MSRRHTAVHEAGHAVMQWLLEPQEIRELWVKPSWWLGDEDVAGHMDAGEAKQDGHRVLMALAGAASEAVERGLSPYRGWDLYGAASDMRIAKTLARAIGPGALEYAKKLVARVVQIPSFRAMVLALAARLEDRSRLSGKEVRTLLEYVYRREVTDKLAAVPPRPSTRKPLRSGSSDRPVVRSIAAVVRSIPARAADGSEIRAYFPVQLES